jgi:hypothetical protein
MKITKEQLKQIIKEEISNFGNLNEMASSELERAEQMLKDAMEKAERLEKSDSPFKDLELKMARMSVDNLKMARDQIKSRSK